MGSTLSPKDRIARARFLLMKEYPFFATLVMHLQPRESPGLGTFSTDGAHMNYDPEVVSERSIGEIMRSNVHESLHCALRHLPRGQGRNEDKWNAAIDLAVNLLIKKEMDRRGAATKMEWTPGLLIDEEYEGMIAEEIYAKLPDAPDLFKGFLEGDLHPDSGGEGEEQGDSPAPRFTGDPETWKRRVIGAVIAARQRGDLPAGLESLVENLVEPELDWTDLVREQAVKAVTMSDYTFLPPSNRYASTGFLLPDMTGEGMGTIALAIDDSGSITDETLRRFVSEAQGILDSYEVEMHLLVCDALVTRHALLRSGDRMPERYEGRGGTDFRPVFEKIGELGIKPNALIFLTDGDGAYPDTEPPYPVIWVLTRDTAVPFGEVINVKEA